MDVNQVLDRIRTEIIDCGRDNRYRLGAYGFVLNGLEFYLLKIGEKRHVTGQELSRGLAEFALKQFGPLTSDVLSHWGIRTTDDFGNIVYNLIGIELMSKQENDTLEDFSNVFDLARICDGLDFMQIDKTWIRGIKGA